jgi:hypothetical protein
MSLALYASPYNNNGTDNSTDNLISKKRLAHHNKTQKYYNRDNNNSNQSNQSNQSDKVKNIIKKIHDNSMYNDSIDGVEMGDFSPLSPPESSGVNRTIDKSNFKESYTGIGIEDDNDADNYNYNSSKNSSVNALTSSDNSNYYTIPSDNNSRLSSQSNQQNQSNQSNQQNQSTQQNQSNQSNHPNASNYLDSIEYNNLNNNYGDSKTIEEYYKKFSPNYSYGTVSNWNRNAQSQSQSNMNNKKIYANGNIDNSSSPFLPSLMSSSSHTNNENSILIEKLNYMIHLLEEQQDERTNNVTEEVILYCFLGVFMIFIVDSFTRVGKYVR